MRELPRAGGSRKQVSMRRAGKARNLDRMRFTKRNIAVIAVALVTALVAVAGISWAVGTANQAETSDNFKVEVSVPTTTTAFPGKQEAVNATVTPTINAAAYIFAWVSCETDVISGYTVASGWTKLTSGTTDVTEGGQQVYYRAVDVTGTGSAISFVTKARYSSRLTNNDLDNLNSTFKVESKVVQQEGFNSALDAYKGENFTASTPHTFTHANNLANVDSYLYRVGNADKSTVALGSLFKAIANDGEETAEVVSSDVKITVENLDSDLSASGTYTANSSDWTKATIQFSGQGPVKVTIQEGDDGTPYSLNLVVVNGKNVTSASSVTSSNIVLLDDVSTTSIAIQNGYTLYGNGFAVKDSRNQPSNTAGFVEIKAGTLDNVQLIGYEPTTATASASGVAGCSPSVHVAPGAGEIDIYNSYISGGRLAFSVESGTIYAENTTFDGGAVANMQLSGGKLTLKNCTTTSSTRGGLKGLGIRISTSDNVHLTLEGTFSQHNWLTESEIPSTYSTMLSDVYKDSTYAASGYVNMGILCLSDSVDINETTTKTLITDNTTNDYGYITKTSGGRTATAYTAKATMFSTDAISGSGYTAYQYAVIPDTSFTYPSTQTDDTHYCYYDSTSSRVNIGFVQDTSTPSYSWGAGILMATQFGKELDVSVRATNADGTTSGCIASGNTVTFSTSGDYTVTYTYTAPYNYDASVTRGSVTYTKTLAVHVTAYEPEAVVYHPQFSYVSSWKNSAKTTTIAGKTWVMPDVSATGTYIGSTTVSGTTVYFPVVTVGPTSSNGNTTYSSGKGYYFTPVFNAINITDYNQETGASQYTYNSSSTTWPHGKAQASGPDSSVFGYDTSGATPYARSMNVQYYGYGKNNNGLCYTAKEIEKDNNASTHLVKYFYVGNDGATYNYYIQYSFTKMTYSSGGCVPSGTLVTLADGLQKAIEDVTSSDRLRVWNFFTGSYDEQDISILVNHGEDTYKVVRLAFDDGSELGVIAEHGLFDYDLNKFIYIDSGHNSEYIGHRFVKERGDGGYDLVTLEDVSISQEVTSAWSITSAYTSNAFANGLLTVAPPEDFYNWIEMDGKLHYNNLQLLADVLQYGLYSYEDFEGYVTPEQFEQWNGAFLKIPVSKGYFTYDYILELIDQYGSWMPAADDVSSAEASE